MKSQQFADEINAKSFNAADVYDKSTLIEVNIEGVDASSRHSLRNY